MEAEEEADVDVEVVLYRARDRASCLHQLYIWDIHRKSDGESKKPFTQEQHAIQIQKDTCGRSNPKNLSLKNSNTYTE